MQGVDTYQELSTSGPLAALLSYRWPPAPRPFQRPAQPRPAPAEARAPRRHVNETKARMNFFLYFVVLT